MLIIVHTTVSAAKSAQIISRQVRERAGAFTGPRGPP
jgi:hypothetical protein